MTAVSEAGPGADAWLLTSVGSDELLSPMLQANELSTQRSICKAPSGPCEAAAHYRKACQKAKMG